MKWKEVEWKKIELVKIMKMQMVGGSPWVTTNNVLTTVSVLMSSGEAAAERGR